MTPNAKRKLIHYWRRHVRPILVLVLVFTAFRSSLADWNDVPTGSMKPTIFEGDRIFVNKLAYGLKVPFTTIHLFSWSGPQRGEVAVFYSPANGMRLVKRVVGIPGDHIKVSGGLLSITSAQGQSCTPTYTPYTPDIAKLPIDLQKYHRFFTEQLGDHAHVVALNDQRQSLREGEYTLKEGEYFMMGDNRDNSGDSRVFGPVPRNQILGRANRVVFSLDYDDYYLPRANRFFHALP